MVWFSFLFVFFVFSCSQVENFHNFSTAHVFAGYGWCVLCGITINRTKRRIGKWQNDKCMLLLQLLALLLLQLLGYQGGWKFVTNVLGGKKIFFTFSFYYFVFILSEPSELLTKTEIHVTKDGLMLGQVSGFDGFVFLLLLFFIRFAFSQLYRSDSIFILFNFFFVTLFFFI